MFLPFVFNFFFSFAKAPPRELCPATVKGPTHPLAHFSPPGAPLAGHAHVLFGRGQWPKVSILAQGRPLHHGNEALKIHEAGKATIRA
jgi:hypothetical protein